MPDKPTLLRSFHELLQNAGQALISPSAYDTAWVARIEDFNSPESTTFPEALTWLGQHQHPDGSWGNGNIADRLLATLAVVIALAEKGRRQEDRLQVQAGLDFIQRSAATLQTASDVSSILPIGFELLLGTLIQEAQAQGLHLPTWIFEPYEPYRQQKLSLMANLSPAKLRSSSALFSLEFMGPQIAELGPENFIDQTGSVGGSPAATAATLRYVQDPDVRRNALSYLTASRLSPSPTGQAENSGASWGFATNFDLFEKIWILYNLLLCRHFHNPGLKNDVNRLLDDILLAWTPNGLSFSSYSFPDGDDTALGYVVLAAGGRNICLDPLLKYWHHNHLLTYQNERDASISTNIHGLEAFVMAGDYSKARQLQNYLLETRGAQPYWKDKWQASPYYATGHFVVATVKLDHSQSNQAIEWLVKSQHADGGWGFEAETSVEETAYALQALIYYAEVSGWTQVLSEGVKRGARYLRERYTSNILKDAPPLWIGKNRYTPYLVVRAAHLATLLLAEEYGL